MQKQQIQNPLGSKIYERKRKFEPSPALSSCFISELGSNNRPTAGIKFNVEYLIVVVDRNTNEKLKTFTCLFQACEFVHVVYHPPATQCHSSYNTN